MSVHSPLRPLRRMVFVVLACSGFAIAQPLPAGCNMGELATVPLKFTDDMRPVADAHINGIAIPAMVNIGSAQGAVINKKTLDRLGIPVRSIVSTQFRRETDSSVSNNPTTNLVTNEALSSMIDDFAFGVSSYTKKSFLVEDFMDDTFGARIGAAGILNNDVELALDAGYLKYFKPDGCIGAHLAYWDPQAVAVRTFYDPLKNEPRPVFRAQINGQDVLALLSTGTAHSYIPRTAAVRLGLTPDSAGARREDPLPGHAADNPVWSIPVAHMKIGALDVNDFDLRLVDLRHSGEVLILGADFLHRHRVYMAMSQSQIYFSPITEKRRLKEGSVDVIPHHLN